MGQIGFQEPLGLHADVVATVLEDGALLLDLDTKYLLPAEPERLGDHAALRERDVARARPVGGRTRRRGPDVASEIDCFVGSLVAEDLLETVGTRRGPRFRAQRGMVHPDARETGRAAAASDRQRIRPDDSACGVSAVEAAAFGCGPLEVDVSGGPPALVDKVVEALSLFDHVWPSQPRMVRIRVESAPFVAPVDATYLSCARMVVGAPGDDLLEATTLTGAAASGRLATNGRLDDHRTSGGGCRRHARRRRGSRRARADDGLAPSGLGAAARHGDRRRRRELRAGVRAVRRREVHHDRGVRAPWLAHAG